MTLPPASDTEERNQSYLEEKAMKLLPELFQQSLSSDRNHTHKDPRDNEKLQPYEICNSQR